MEQSDSLEALKELADGRRMAEHLAREVAILESSLNELEPDSDEAKELRSKIRGRKSELFAVSTRCQELRGIWERGSMKAKKQESPGQ